MTSGSHGWCQSSTPAFKGKDQTDGVSHGQGGGLNLRSKEGRPFLCGCHPCPFPSSLHPPAACTPTVCSQGLPGNPLTAEEATAQRGTVFFKRPRSTRVNGSPRLPAPTLSRLPCLCRLFPSHQTLSPLPCLLPSPPFLLPSGSFSRSLLTLSAFPVVIIIILKTHQDRRMTLSSMCELFLPKP